MKKLIKAMLVIAAMFASPVTFGSPLQDDQATLIYSLVYGVTHLPLPEHPPTIHLTTNAKLQELACPHGCAGIKGFQLDDAVYIDEALDMSEVLSASVLFHEFVHYYQWAQKGRAKNCAEWKDRELAAYHWQNEVLYKAGHSLVQPPLFDCSNAAQKYDPGCEEFRSDVHRIGEAVEAGVLEESITEYAKAAPDLNEERRADILALIAEAYKAGIDGIGPWAAKKFNSCEPEK